LGEDCGGGKGRGEGVRENLWVMLIVLILLNRTLDYLVCCFRAPKNICFGRGSSRGFHIPTRGKPKGKKKHQGSSQQVCF